MFHLKLFCRFSSCFHFLHEIKMGNGKCLLSYWTTVTVTTGADVVGSQSEESTQWVWRSRKNIKLMVVQMEYSLLCSNIL